MDWTKAAQAAMKEFAAAGELCDEGKALAAPLPGGGIKAQPELNGNFSLRIERGGATFVMHGIAPAAEPAAKAAWTLRRIMDGGTNPQRWIDTAVACAARLGDVIYLSINPGMGLDGTIGITCGDYFVAGQRSPEDRRKGELTISRGGRCVTFRTCTPEDAPRIIAAALTYLG